MGTPSGRVMAARIGIDDARADLLPDQKPSCVSEFMESATVCMVGDGVNDAPALSQVALQHLRAHD